MFEYNKIIKSNICFNKRGIKMFNKFCLFIYSYRYLIGFYFICLGMMMIALTDITDLLMYLKPNTIIPFLEVFAYQKK